MDDQKSRIPTWAWAFLGLLALAVAFLAFSLLSGDDTDEAPATATSAEQPTGNTPSPSPSTTALDPNESICGLSAGDQSIPEEAPETTWELINGFAVPASQEFGPGIKENNQLKCFAHNPTGALFAAARVLPVMGGSAETAEAFAEDPNQVSYSVESQRQDYLNNLENWEKSSIFQIEGFKLETYDADNVLVTIVAGAPNNTGDQYAQFAFKMQMKWENGDWVLQLPSHLEEPKVIDSLVSENFIPWSGVN